LTCPFISTATDFANRLVLTFRADKAGTFLELLLCPTIREASVFFGIVDNAADMTAVAIWFGTRQGCHIIDFQHPPARACFLHRNYFEMEYFTRRIMAMLIRI
jgi:hypothetical protein